MTQEEPLEPRVSGLASGWIVQPEAATDLPVPEPDIASDVDAPDSEEHSALSSLVLMLLGVFGGLYLLYTWGWFEVAKAYSAVNAAAASGSGIVGGVLQQIVFWIAPAAPALWFVLSVKLTRKNSALALTVALLVGAVLLLPFPMLFGGGGQ